MSVLYSFATVICNAENLITNGGFEDVKDPDTPLHWNIERVLPSDEIITLENNPDLVFKGNYSLKDERYNEKASFRSVTHSVNLNCMAGETVEFGGWIKCVEYLGGNSCYMISVVDGSKKKWITSTLVDENKWTQSSGKYRFKFDGRIRYFGITFRPVTPKRIKTTGKLKRARGVFLYDEIFLRKSTKIERIDDDIKK